MRAKEKVVITTYLDPEALDREMRTVYQVMDGLSGQVIEHALKQFGVIIDVAGQTFELGGDMDLDHVRFLQGALFYWRWLYSIDRIYRGREPFDPPPWDYEDNGIIDSEKWLAEMDVVKDRFWSLFHPHEPKKPGLRLVKG